MAQLLSQLREFIRQSVSTRLFIQGFDMLPLFRNRNFFQAVLPSSYIGMFSVRPLRSTVVTRFFATMGISDSRPVPPCGYVFPQSAGRVAASAPPGLPVSSTNLSLRAVPNHPGKPGVAMLPLFSTPVAGFTILGRPAVFHLASRGRIGFTCITARRFASRDFAKRIAPLHARSATC